MFVQVLRERVLANHWYMDYEDPGDNVCISITSSAQLLKQAID